MPFSVYFSDTSSELDRLRPVLIEQIRDAGMTPLWLDESEKQQPDLPNRVRAKMETADGFIGIVTYKRAWEPGGQDGRSLAEIEFELAQELGKPVAMLLPTPDSPMGMYLRMRALGQNPAERSAQQRFWKQVESGGSVMHFFDEADLSKQVAQILMRWAAGAATSQTLARDGKLNLLPDTSVDVETLAERIADKTAVKVQALQQQRQTELAEQALKYNAALQLQPGELVFGRPVNRTQFKADIFMIMPFDAHFNTVYFDIIQPLVKELGLTIRRGDDFTSTRGIIMEEVWSALNNCRFVIAEITGGNDNVFYELGIAHTLNKPAILITQAARPEDVPFDIRHLRYIRYENSEAGVKQLRADLETTIRRLVADLEEGWGTAT